MCIILSRYALDVRTHTASAVVGEMDVSHDSLLRICGALYVRLAGR